MEISPFANEGVAIMPDPAVLQQMEDEKIRQDLVQKALAEIEEDQKDPRTQDYLIRQDKKTVVKNDQEFALCIAQGVQMKRVGYQGAIHALAEEDATKRAKLARKKARKVSKASRKANR